MCAYKVGADKAAYCFMCAKTFQETPPFGGAFGYDRLKSTISTKRRKAIFLSVQCNTDENSIKLLFPLHFIIYELKSLDNVKQLILIFSPFRQK